MKHLIKDNQIVQSGIPSTFTRHNGQLFCGGYENMTDLHYEDGWREEFVPEYDPVTQRLGSAYYDQVNDVVTYNVVSREDLPELTVARANKIAEVKNRQRAALLETDGYIIRRAETGKSVPQEILNARQAIRVKAQDYETAINALQTVKEVLEFEVGF